MLSDLIYVSDGDPGIARIKRGKGFRYLDPQGFPLRCEKEVARIRALAIPPAYRNVWICCLHNGHIQATGIDEANRKQYRYHAAWTEFRSEAKFDKLPDFGRKLPALRRRVDKILKNVRRDAVFDKETAIAAVVRLLDHTAMRIGGRSRSAQGATTLMTRNVRYDKGGLRLRYTAKGGKRVQSSVSDRRLQRIMEKIHGLPGKRLFQYIGADGLIHPLDSGDVNGWLKQQSGMDDISAKMFRTWHGSVAALEALRRADRPTIKLACTAASEVLCNTPTIARKSYVHPKVLDLAAAADVAQSIAGLPDLKLRGLGASERRLMALISES
ncbi:MAG: DNA topoisomerase IB [Sphingomonadaceae bacterium]|nr:DNA topoisomerase IB [Sphingomonadaceae bacterium]